MLVIGLTGGIGSGKSNTAKVFSALGATVIDTDEIAHQLTAKGTPTLAAIITQFGSIYQLPDGNLDRASLRTKVFSDPATKIKLEALLHPIIKQQVIAEIAIARGCYIILVVPLYFETGAYHNLVNRILVVDSDESQQIARTQARSQLSADDVQAIMANQISRSSRIEQADDILSNQGSEADLEAQIKQIHQRYLTLASQLQN